MVRAILIFVFNLLDVFFTKRWIKIFDESVEANPIARWILQSDTRLIVFKILIPTIALTVLYLCRRRKLANAMLWSIFSLYAALTLTHIIYSIIVGGIMK